MFNLIKDPFGFSQTFQDAFDQSGIPLQPINPNAKDNQAPSLTSQALNQLQNLTNFSTKPAQSLDELIAKGSATDITEIMKKVIPMQNMQNMRKKEIDQIAVLAACPQKNKIIIEGASGVGKTFLIQHLACEIIHQQAPVSLKGKRIVRINTMEPAEWKILNAHSHNCLFYIDEFHSFIKQNNPDELKYRLDDCTAPLIGLTDNYYKIEQDAALARRFHRMPLNEATINETIQLLCKMKNSTEEKLSRLYNCSITIDNLAIETAVKLSYKYFNSRFFPDKANSILEPALTLKIQKEQQKNSKSIHITDQDIKDYIVTFLDKDIETINFDLEEINQSQIHSEIPSSEPLVRYSQNLTTLAIQGKIQPAYGREKELQGTMSALCCVNANNMILYGPAGCGKTRIAEGLACKIAEGDVPQALKGKQVLLLNLESLLSETRYLGQFEARMNELLESARRQKGKFILVIDEIHRIIGAGKGAESHSDMAQSLKPMLARGELPILGMTTTAELEIVKCDFAFYRRFQTQEIAPFNVPQTVTVIKNEIRPLETSYKERFGFDFSILDEALNAIVLLSLDFLPLEAQPAAAFKLLNSICGHLGIERKEKAALIIDESMVIKYVSDFLGKGKNEEEIQNMLMKRSAELHPSSQNIASNEALSYYTENWTNIARQQRFSPANDREEELLEIMTILGCETINNVLILGKSGVGKTTLVQELARRMVEGKVPPHLQDKALLNLKVSELLSPSTKEMNLTSLLDGLKKSAGKYILYVDEIHLLMQAHVKGIAFLEMLKPMLAEGVIRLIGSTTVNESSSILNGGAPLLRRFKMLELKELSAQQSGQILKASKENYQKSYSARFKKTVVIDDNTFTSAAMSAKEHLPGQCLPASAVRLLEDILSDRCVQEWKLAESKEQIQINATVIDAYCQKRFPTKEEAPPLSNWSWELFNGFNRIFSDCAAKITSLWDSIRVIFCCLG